jgi:hypothetical protein
LKRVVPLTVREAAKFNREILGLDQGKGPSDQGKPVPARVTSKSSSAHDMGIASFASDRCDSPQNV